MIGIQGETALDEVTKSPADAALSTTSTNSVQNKVITKEINEINASLVEESFGVSYTGITGYKRLGTVWFEWNNLDLGTINVNSFQTIYTIPAGYRPLVEFYLPVVIMGHEAQLYVSTNGTVQLKIEDTGIAYNSVSLMFSYHIH